MTKVETRVETLPFLLTLEEISLYVFLFISSLRFVNTKTYLRVS